MSDRGARRHNLSAPAARPDRELSRAELLERAGTFLALTVLATRPLVVSEDADAGSGLLFVLLAWLPIGLWTLGGMLRGEEVRFRVQRSDLFLVAFLIWAVASTWFASARGPALNLLLEWSGLVLLYWGLREFLLPRYGTRRLMSWFLGLACALSAYAVYQAFWGLEQLRREFQRDPITALRAVGVVPGSPQAQTFLNRLNSHEAFATFALANSLAGFLLPWAMVALQEFFERVADRSSRWLRRALSTAAFLLIAVGVLLTQSRSAIALLLGAGVVLGILWYARAVRRGWVHLTVLAVVIGGVLVVGRVRGKVDEKFLTGAVSSLRYRLEYWTATVAMVRDHPWFGVGPGNFRSHYLRYKLPTSSEEIAEPHNFLLEAAASFGLPGAVLFLLFLATSVPWWTAIRQRTVGEQRDGGATMHVGFLTAVTVCSLLLAYWVGGVEAPTAVALGAVWLGFFHASAKSSPPFVSTALPLLLLMGHLLFNGGLQIPGVAVAMWGLLAMSGRPTRLVTLRGRWGVAVSTAAYFAVLFALSRWHVIPMMTSRAALASGDRYLAIGQTQFAVDAYERAVRSCPLNCQAWAALARTRLTMAVRRPLHGQDWPLALRAVQEWHACDPASPWPCRDAAVLWHYHAVRSGNPGAWQEALKWIRRARERYPTDLRLAYLHAQILWDSGRKAAAARVAGETLERNALCPHPDRRLSARAVANLQNWAGVAQ